MKTAILLLLSGLLLSCEPYNLERIDFNNCVKPTAAVGATTTKLKVDFFVDKAVGDITTATWTFGDGRGLPQTGDRVSYTFDRPGTYTVTLSLTNRCNQSFAVTRAISVAN